MFETIKYIFHDKKSKELDNVLLENFSPYITQKSFSFYGHEVYNSDYINNTLNIYSKLFDSVEDKFNFYNNIIPLLPKKRYNYLKKSKPDKEKIDVVKIPEFYSKREIDMMREMDKYLNEPTTR